MIASQEAALLSSPRLSFRWRISEFYQTGWFLYSSLKDAGVEFEGQQGGDTNKFFKNVQAWGFSAVLGAKEKS